MSAAPTLSRAIDHLNKAASALKEARVSREIVRDRDVVVVSGMAAAVEGIATVVHNIRRECEEE